MLRKLAKLCGDRLGFETFVHIQGEGRVLEAVRDGVMLAQCLMEDGYPLYDGKSIHRDRIGKETEPLVEGGDPFIPAGIVEDSGWPNSSHIWPKEEPILQVGIDLKRIILAAQALGASRKEECGQALVSFWGPDKPIVIELDGGNRRAMVMPLHPDGLAKRCKWRGKE